MAKVASSSRGGSKPGERRGGRKAGTPNKATADVKAAAQKYTAEAIETLRTIMRDGESEASRIAASNSILDRGHGKPSSETNVSVGGVGGGAIKLEVEYI